MIERTAKGGGELVDLLGTSAWYAPGAAAQIVDAIVLTKRVCRAPRTSGRVGIDGLYMECPSSSGPPDRAIVESARRGRAGGLMASADAVRRSWRPES
jgi:malate/lactate dehydrogenase